VSAIVSESILDMANAKAKPKSTQSAASRVLIIEDHPIVCERVAQLINNQADLSVCGEANEPRAALDLIAVTRPDLVITGLSFQHAHGLGLVKDLQAYFPRLKVLVFSTYDESLYAERAVRAGARGFVHKREATDELLRAIRHVLSGQVYLSDKIAASKLREFFGRPVIKSGSALEQLSDRELEVLQLIGAGRSTRQIAAALHLDVKTIETYRARIKIKLNLTSSSQLIQQAKSLSAQTTEHQL
jgi:DNA-binding NarL/FixJ family response regulator